MEHLFKLKKDGKTVGYSTLIKYYDPLDNSRHWTMWGYSKNGKKWIQQRITFDTAHPFVTKDKNGKDVFAGDKAFGNVWMEDLPVHRVVGEIIYHNCGYCLQTPTTYYHLNDLKDIELIEDK